MNVSDLVNPNMRSGYDHVHTCDMQGGRRIKPYTAIACKGGKTARLDKSSGRTWRGTRRATPEESAQDYCDYVNGLTAVATPFKLNTAGHVRVRSGPTPSPKRVKAYKLLAEAAIEERRSAGYVYCITDGTAYKVGKTVNHPSNRVAELQTGNPRLLELLSYREVENMAEAEFELHRLFAHLTVLGEWFLMDSLITTEFGLESV